MLRAYGLDRTDLRIYTPEMFGAIGDGDDTEAIQTGIDTTSANGGIILLANRGAPFVISQKIIIRNNVYLVGHGMPTIKLADGGTTTVIESEDFLTLSGTTDDAGVNNWGIRDIIIDGNVDNVGSVGTNEGHGVAAYGYNFLIHNLRVVNTAREGIHTEYRGSAGEPYNGRVSHLTTVNTHEHGWYNRVSDLHVNDLNIQAPGSGSVSTYDGLHLAPGGAVRGSNVNIWSSEETNFIRYAMYVGAGGTKLTNIHLEAGGLANLVVDSDNSSITGVLSYNARGDTNIIAACNQSHIQAIVYPGFWAGTKGVQVGDATMGAATNNTFDIKASSMEDGMFVIEDDDGGNIYKGVHFTTDAGDLNIVGTPAWSSEVNVTARGAVSASYSKQSTTGALAAAGSVTGNAAVVTHACMTLTASGSGQGVRLTSGFAVNGMEVALINSDASNAIKIYPHTSGKFQGLSSNVAISLPPLSMATLKFAQTGGWSALIGSAPVAA